jgi:hypothetical protein
MDAEVVLKHRVRNEQTSGEKKLLSKGVIIFKFFPARTQIFRQIVQTFGSRRERVNPLVTNGYFCTRQLWRFFSAAYWMVLQGF